MNKLLTIFAFFIGLQVANAAAYPAADSSLQKKDTTMVPIAQPTASTYQNVFCKRQLDSIQQEVPLDYNEYVQAYIDIYSRHRDEMAHVLGLTKYYFPIYEKAFREAGIPEEIKYLSIVESKLDPYAISRVGATGPWQFMYATAKLYRLNMDNYVDERRDPIQASYAAAAYLKDAYQQFGDWLLAIASYNCGKSNVLRAIEKAGGATDFWSIRQYLPAETRGYVPAYIAISYVMNYYKKLGITPEECNFSLKTDTLMVNKFVSLDNLSKTLNLDVKELTILNPSYTRAVVNGTANAPKRLVIPQLHSFQYPALYDALDGDGVIPMPTVKFAAYTPSEPERRSIHFHKVRKGETLAGIADRYGISVHELKVWNHLSSNKAAPGKKLKVSGDGDEEAAVHTRSHSSRG